MLPCHYNQCWKQQHIFNALRPTAWTSQASAAYQPVVLLQSYWDLQGCCIELQLLSGHCYNTPWIRALQRAHGAKVMRGRDASAKPFCRAVGTVSQSNAKQDTHHPVQLVDKDEAGHIVAFHLAVYCDGLQQ